MQSQADLLTRPCPLCAQDKATLLWRKGTLDLVRCRHCSMVYANPVERELASGAFYDRRARSFYLSPDKLESDHAAVRFERELRLFRSYCASGSVLDVGCSTGAFLLTLNKRYPGDYSIFGTDVASGALDYAERGGVQVIRASFSDLATPGLAFDAVTFWAVMEHLVEPGQFLNQAASLLKPGGCCFILVPNMKSLAVRLLGPKYRYIMADHVNYFTPATLHAFGRRCDDLNEVRLTSMHFNPLVILQDLRGGHDRVPDAERARLLRRTTSWKQNRWLQPVKLCYSAVERFLASFNLADNLVIVLRKKPAPAA